jgi:hypothetical protein
LVLFTLVASHVVVNWVDRCHLRVLVILVIGHCWVMVSVSYWNADVLWDLQFAGLTDLVEGTDRYMRVGSVANTKASGFSWDELMACCDLFVLIR